MEVIKDTLAGIGLMAICFVLFVIYSVINQLQEEKSKRGAIAKFIYKLFSGSLLIYIGICSAVGIIIGLYFLFNN